MPYEVVSSQAKRLNEQGSRFIYGDLSHSGESVHADHAQRNTFGILVWTNVSNVEGTYLCGYVEDSCFEPVR